MTNAKLKSPTRTPPAPNAPPHDLAAHAQLLVADANDLQYLTNTWRLLYQQQHPHLANQHLDIKELADTFVDFGSSGPYVRK
jgi:hypothetical protein